MSHSLKRTIAQALHEMNVVIRTAQGPIFTDGDHGRLLRCFMQLCAEMAEQDLEFKAKAKEAERIEAQSKKASKVPLLDLFDEIWGDDNDK